MNAPFNPKDHPSDQKTFLRYFAAPEGKRTVLLSRVHASDFDLVFNIYTDILPLLPCSSNLRPVFFDDKVFFFMDYSTLDRDTIFYAPEILSMVHERIFRDYLSLKRNLL